jgi:predicted AAA+ superfamily ATPase
LNRVFKRALVLPAPETESFFLWGPRQTGKTTPLREPIPTLSGSTC